MGSVKNQMSDFETMEGLAKCVAVAADLGSWCPVHEGEFISEGADEDLLVEAYRIGNSRITKGEIVLPSTVSRPDFSALIKEVVEMGPDACPECERIFGKDD